MYVRRHLLFGWGSLLFFLTLGLILEAFHGFKIGWYLNVTNESRRLMLTLSHAHGALLGLVHIAFALTLRAQQLELKEWVGAVSLSLVGASVLLPGGFLLAGFFIWGGDPGLGVFVAPVGGLLFLLAIATIVRGLWREPKV